MTKYEVRLDKEKNCEKKSIKEAILSARKIAFENQKHLVEIYEVEDGYVPAIPVCVFQGSGERAGYSVLAFDAEKDGWEEVAYYATEREAFDCMAAMLLEDAAGGYYSEMCVGHKGEPLFSGLWTTEDEELHRLDDFRPEEDLELLAAEALRTAMEKNYQYAVFAGNNFIGATETLLGAKRLARKNTDNLGRVPFIYEYAWAEETSEGVHRLLPCADAYATYSYECKRWLDKSGNVI